jgi:hypothetical protein
MEESRAEWKAGKKDEGKSSGHATKFIYLNNISHGQNLSSTSGEPEFVIQYR